MDQRLRIECDLYPVVMKRYDEDRKNVRYNPSNYEFGKRKNLWQTQRQLCIFW